MGQGQAEAEASAVAAGAVQASPDAAHDDGAAAGGGAADAPAAQDSAGLDPSQMDKRVGATGPNWALIAACAVVAGAGWWALFNTAAGQSVVAAATGLWSLVAEKVGAVGGSGGWCQRGVGWRGGRRGSRLRILGGWPVPGAVAMALCQAPTETTCPPCASCAPRSCLTSTCTRARRAWWRPLCCCCPPSSACRSWSSCCPVRGGA